MKNKKIEELLAELPEPSLDDLLFLIDETSKLNGISREALMVDKYILNNLIRIVIASLPLD